MKYALLVHPRANLGDNAQVYALHQIYRRMNILEEDIVVITRYNVEELVKNGDTFIVPLVTADIIYHDFIMFTIEKKIDKHFIFIPISLGQTRWTFKDEARLAKFSQCINKFVVPIGCRDYDSASMYEALGYNSYVNGCITNTFPRRDDKVYDKVYIIDVPKIFWGYIPCEIKNDVICLSQENNDSKDDKCGQDDYMASAERYELLKDNAKLVITCRYHIAHPCVAMGIPVIMVENCDPTHHWTFDSRFPAMNPYIHFYTKEQWGDIDWDPKSVDFEGFKQVMVDLIISRIRNAVEVCNYQNEANKFFTSSKERFYGVFQKNKSKMDMFGFTYYLDKRFLLELNKTEFKFYLYGLSDRYIERNECLMLDYILRHYPQADFLGFVDSFKKGDAFGKPIVHSSDMKIDEDTYVIVSAYNANSYVDKLFEECRYDKKHLWLMPSDILFYVYQL
ncbi:MAG: polysaccharide pyruvyl transferase family protein [Chitinispirillia bacterium]|nr:polysaccharide pyruvyl transferase family protein [Chitinispirillia bacterium]